MSPCSKVLHLFVALQTVFIVWYDVNFVDFTKIIPRHENDVTLLAGRVKYLTVWNLLLQAFFFTVCFINDLMETNSSAHSLIKKFKDMLMCSLAFPLSMFVGLTFWGLYIVDRELVLPKVLDLYFPWWLNHCMHTNIMIFILIEMATSFRQYPPRKAGIAVLTTFMVIYLIWIHIIHSYTDMWVYPVLQVLNFPMRMVFFISLLLLSVGLYIVGEKLNNCLWKTSIDSRKRKH